MHEQGALPPLSGEETAVNEIDSFPTHRHNHLPPSVFDKQALIHTQAGAHTQTHMHQQQQPEMKAINRL